MRYTKKQAEAATKLVRYLMESRKRDGAFSGIYPQSWNGDVFTFARMAAEIADLDGKEATDFAIEVAAAIPYPG